MPASFYDQIYQLITFIDSFLSILFTSIGLYLLITKRKSIKGLFKLLTNYSLQNTISELHGKLDRLNGFNADDKENRSQNEITCILHEIDGQIEGNTLIKSSFIAVQSKLQGYIKNPEELTEPRKRGLVSELREKLRTLNVETYNNLVRGEDE